VPATPSCSEIWAAVPTSLAGNTIAVRIETRIVARLSPIGRSKANKVRERATRSRCYMPERVALWPRTQPHQPTIGDAGSHRADHHEGRPFRVALP
jgi:hypothetical protein